jgi:hypothetical protein
VPLIPARRSTTGYRPLSTRSGSQLPLRCLPPPPPCPTRSFRGSGITSRSTCLHRSRHSAYPAKLGDSDRPVTHFAFSLALTYPLVGWSLVHDPDQGVRRPVARGTLPGAM